MIDGMRTRGSWDCASSAQPLPSPSTHTKVGEIFFVELIFKGSRTASVYSEGSGILRLGTPGVLHIVLRGTEVVGIDSA
jgi:hypothetical protein